MHEYNKLCLLDNSSIFIGLISSPFSFELEFYENEFEKGLFEGYRNGLKRYFSEDDSKSKEFERYFYKPVPYFLFGKFDLGILSLVDDYEFSIRTFHPFDPLMQKNIEKNYREDFAYQLIIGPSPKFAENDNLVKLFNKIIFNNKSYPLIGICQIKINSSFLIGCGSDFLRCFIKTIKIIYKDKFKDKPIDIIILESYSWHEITLLITSNAYSKITDLVLLIREMTFGDMKKILEDKQENMELEILKSLNSLIIDIVESKKNNYDSDFNHICENTTTIFGFKLEIFKDLKNNKSSDLLDLIDGRDKVLPFSRWFCKGGHLKNSINIISNKNPNEASICIGRGDFLYPEYKQGFVQTKKFIKKFILAQVAENLHKDILSTHSIPVISKKINHLKLVDEKHFYFYKELKLLRYKVDDIYKLDKTLKTLNIPRITHLKLLNIFSNYNDGIQDPILFSNFFELKPFLDTIISTVKKYSEMEEYDQFELNKKLDCVTTDFEIAYKNRFHDSYRMGEIFDFNIEFKGGIQQLISAFDGVFKIISHVYGNPDCFVYVSGSPQISVSEYSLKLNYLHIFQPESFILVASHEASSFSFDKANFSELINYTKFIGSGSEEKRIEDNIHNSLSHIQFKSDDDKIKKYISPKYFHYIMTDLTSLYFTYNCDISLYTFWYINSFLSFPNHYYFKDNIKETDFVPYFLRYITLIKLFNINIKSCTKNIKNNKIRPLLNEWTERLNSFMEKFMSQKDFNSWFQEAKRIIEYLYLENNKNILTREKKCTDTLLDKIENICKFFINRSVEIIDLLKKGYCYSFLREKGLLESQYVHLLFYSYLRLIKEEWDKGDLALIRNQDGDPIINKNHSNYLLDPRGGNFIYGAKARRDYFQYRSAINMTFWDISMKNKKYELLKHLQERSIK